MLTVSTTTLFALPVTVSPVSTETLTDGTPPTVNRISLLLASPGIPGWPKQAAICGCNATAIAARGPSWRSLGSV